MNVPSPEWTLRAVMRSLRALTHNAPGKSLLLGLVIGSLPCRAQADVVLLPDLPLALQLAQGGDHAGAAIEFRRAALITTNAHDQARYYWAAAFECRRAGQYATADKLLDRAEDASAEMEWESLLLRAENAVADRRWNEAVFGYQALLDGSGPGEAKRLAARRLSGLYVCQGDFSAAREQLMRTPLEPNAVAALEEYQRGCDRRPWLGGMLGLIPGAGYVYSGEYANGFRSLLLNGLFIFGMVNTAQREQWGAFAPISFFELTWYSGSIYGGIDAAHRFNDKRRDECTDRVNGGADFCPDLHGLPLLNLRFTF